MHLVHLIVHPCISSIGPSIHPPALLSQLSVSLSQSSINFSCLSFRISLSSLSLHPSVHPSIRPRCSLNYQSLSLNHPSISLVYLSVPLSCHSLSIPKPFLPIFLPHPCPVECPKDPSYLAPSISLLQRTWLTQLHCLSLPSMHLPRHVPQIKCTHVPKSTTPGMTSIFCSLHVLTR